MAREQKIQYHFIPSFQASASHSMTTARIHSDPKPALARNEIFQIIWHQLVLREILTTVAAELSRALRAAITTL